jgi:glutathione S-transferase
VLAEVDRRSSKHASPRCSRVQTWLAATGSDTIPTLLIGSETPIAGEEAIVLYLDVHFVEPTEAEAHRAKTAKARHRYLEEECE